MNNKQRDQEYYSKMILELNKCKFNSEHKDLNKMVI